MSRVLIVEDEVATRQVLVDLLTHLGYDVVSAGSGVAGLKLAEESDPDLVVLDLGLPDLPGMDVIRQLRTWSQVPVLVLSGSTWHQRKADALDAGADDFLDKPFNVGELRARLRAAERRLTVTGSGMALARSYDELVIDALRRSLTRDGAEVRLTEIEWLLLDQLSAQPGRVLTHRWLIKHVWGPQAGLESMAALRSHLRSVRAKIGDDAHESRYIRTESGVGYRWISLPSAVTTDETDPVLMVRLFGDQLDSALRAHGYVPGTRVRDAIAHLAELVADIAGVATHTRAATDRGEGSSE